MSWDIYLERPKCDHCGRDSETVFERNYTHNMNGAIREAWGGKCWKDVDGKRAEDVLPSLRHAIAMLRNEPAAFKRYEPGNGWGSVEGVTKFLEDCARAMEESPGAIIRVSG